MATSLPPPLQLAGLDLAVSPDHLMGVADDTVATLEKALVTRDEWLGLAAEGSELGLWYWNEETSELFWDRKTREIFGIDPNQSMRERARMVGGDVRIETRPTVDGTQVLAVMPLGRESS